MVNDKSGQSRVVLLTTFLAFSTLYTLQPLLPQLVGSLDISIQQAALLVTVMLVPMGFAPLFFGYFLQAVPAKTMLRLALFLLILDQLALFFAQQYWQLLTLRFLQGLILPALFTALMTYCSKMAAPGNVRKMMGWYVASTIIGGCSSRALSGLLATSFDWQWIFLIMGIALIGPLYLTRNIDADAEINFARIDSNAIRKVWSKPVFSYAYLALVFVFFVFGGILALLPFRLQQIDPSITTLTIALVYIGYLFGIPASIFSASLVHQTGSEKTVLLCSLLLVAVGIAGLFTRSTILPFILMIPLAGGMFLIHSTLSGLINHLAGVGGDTDKGVVNGIYVSVYYLSGTLGSWLPVIAYEALPWHWLLVLSLLIIAVSGLMVIRLQTEVNHYPVAQGIR